MNNALARGTRRQGGQPRHPTEVEATVAVARDLAEGKVWAVFQPHLYSRTERVHDEFGESLTGADEVVVTDV